MCIKAKSETVERLPSFRQAFEKRRCVVPADGFYEMPVPRPGANSYGFIRRRACSPDSSKHGDPGPASGLPLSRQPPIERSTRFTSACQLFSTKRAGRLDESRVPDPLSLKRLLVPAASNDLLVVLPASPLVNNLKNEGPELLEDLSLFGH
jgi:putative SOS response-associated peptidase YedK